MLPLSFSPVPHAANHICTNVLAVTSIRKRCPFRFLPFLMLLTTSVRTCLLLHQFANAAPFVFSCSSCCKPHSHERACCYINSQMLPLSFSPVPYAANHIRTNVLYHHTKPLCQTLPLKHPVVFLLSFPSYNG